MKNIVTALLCVLFLGSLCMAENNYKSNDSEEISIFGHVVDKTTQEHIPFVTICVKGTNKGTTSDEDGHFVLGNLAQSDIVLQFSLIGYKQFEMPVNLHSGVASELKVELEPDLIKLDELVVTGNRTGINKRKSSSIVQTLNPKTVKSLGTTCVADIMHFQPGVRVEDNCQNCGRKEVRINGLAGNYTQLMIDSRPIVSSVASLYGVEQFPPCIVQRVEVIKGGGSAIYGGSAVAGSINIITQSPEQNTAKISHSVTGIGGSSAFDNSTAFNVSAVSHDKQSGVIVFGQKRSRQAYSYYDDGYTTLPKLDLQLLGTKFCTKFTQRSKLDVSYLYINDFRRGGNMLDLQPEQANVDEETSNSIHLGNLDYNYWFGNCDLNVYSSLTSVARKSYAGGRGSDQEPDTNAMLYHTKTDDFSVTGGASLKCSIDKCLFMPAQLIVGIEYSHNSMEDNALGFNCIEKQKTGIGGIFLQNEWQNDKWTILLGARADKHNLIDNVVFSPRVNVRFTPVEPLIFRVSYSEGYRAPQIFDEDLHVSMSAGERFKTRNADGLKTERSRSLSLSVDFSHDFGFGQFDWLVEAFHTRLSNVFIQQDLDITDENGCQLLMRTNGSGAKVYGLSGEMRVGFSRQISVDCGLAVQRSRYDEPEEWSEEAEPSDKMFRTPDVYGYLTAEFTPVRNLDIDLTCNYNGSMTVAHFAGSGTSHDIAVETPDFWDFSVEARYLFKLPGNLNLDLSAGVKNVLNQYQDDFDRGYDRDTEYLYGPMLPRSWFVGIGIGF